jgi:hypothetical protein
MTFAISSFEEELKITLPLLLQQALQKIRRSSYVSTAL